MRQINSTSLLRHLKTSLIDHAREVKKVLQASQINFNDEVNGLKLAHPCVWQRENKRERERGGGGGQGKVVGRERMKF